MSNNHYTYPINPHPDPILSSSYRLDMLARDVTFLQNPWIKNVQRPRIMVSGVANWLAHYLLFVLTESMELGEIVAVDDVPRPAYLESERYGEVKYLQMQTKWQDLASMVLSFRPHIIFHADYLWHIHIPNPIRLFATNVCLTESLCDAAQKAQVMRIIMFSDAAVYGPGEDVADEDNALQPESLIGQSFCQLESLTQQYHQPGITDIYHLRVPALYGPYIPTGIMVIAHLLAEGILLGPPENAGRLVSVVSGEDLALVAFLLAMAPQPGHRIFNVATHTMPLSSLLQQLENSLPGKKS